MKQSAVSKIEIVVIWGVWTVGMGVLLGELLKIYREFGMSPGFLVAFGLWFLGCVIAGVLASISWRKSEDGL